MESSWQDPIYFNQTHNIPWEQVYPMPFRSNRFYTISVDESYFHTILEQEGSEEIILFHHIVLQSGKLAQHSWGFT